MSKFNGIWQPLISALFVGAGFACVWEVAVGVIGSVVSANARRVGVSEQEWEFLGFQPDGTPVIKSAGRYHDLEGKDAVAPPHWLMATYLAADADRPAYAATALWRSRLLGFNDAEQPSGFWYLVWDGKPHGSAYLIGYGSETYARLGFLGKTGFREDEPPMEDRIPFDGQADGLHARVHLARANQGLTLRLDSRPPDPVPGGIPPWVVFVQGDDDKIYRVDLKKRGVSVFFEGEPILASLLASTASLVFNTTMPENLPFALLVRTGDAVLEIKADGKVFKKFPLPEELRAVPIHWAKMPSGNATWAYTVDYGDKPGARAQYRVFWMDGAGQVTRRLTFDEPLRPGDSPSMKILIVAILPSPACLFGVALLAGRSDVEELWPALMVSAAVGLGLAWCCYRRERRFAGSFTARVIWPIFVFGFGLFGWIGYRFGRSWPTLEQCPACHVTVPRDRLMCNVCHIEFPAPLMTGTEIIA
jgi:hypothetical protein